MMSRVKDRKPTPQTLLSLRPNPKAQNSLHDQVNEAEALRWPWNRKFQVDEMDACREAKDQGEGFEVQPFMLLRVLSIGFRV